MSRKVKTNEEASHQSVSAPVESLPDLSDSGFAGYDEDADLAANSATEVCQPDESFAPPPVNEGEARTEVKFDEAKLLSAVTTGNSSSAEVAASMTEFDSANANIKATINAVFAAVKDSSARSRLVGWITGHRALANVAVLNGSFLCAVGETLCSLKDQSEGQPADKYAYAVLCHAMGDHVRVLSAPSLSDSEFAKKYNVSSGALLGAVILCEQDWGSSAQTVVKHATTKLGVYGNCAYVCVDGLNKALSVKKIAKSTINAKSFSATLTNAFNSFSITDPCDERIAVILAMYFGTSYVTACGASVGNISSAFNINAIPTRMGELTKNEVTVQDLDNEFLSALAEGWGGAADYRINVCLSVIFQTAAYTKHLAGALKKLAAYIGDPVAEASLLKELKITHVIGVDGCFHKALSDSDDIGKDYCMLDPFLKLDGFTGVKVATTQKVQMSGIFGEQPDLIRELREFITATVCTSKTVAVLDPETRSAHNCACQIARGAFSFETLKAGIEASGVSVTISKVANSLTDGISTVFGLTSKKFSSSAYTSLLSKSEYDAELVAAITQSASTPVIRQFVTSARMFKQISFSCIGVKGWAKLTKDLYSKKVCALGAFSSLSQSSNVSNAILHCAKGDAFAVKAMDATAQSGSIVSCAATPLSMSYYRDAFYLKAGVVTCAPKNDAMSSCISYWQGKNSSGDATAKAVLTALGAWINSPQSMSGVPKSAFVEAEVGTLRGLSGNVSYSQKGSLSAPNSSAAVQFVSKQRTGFLANVVYMPARQLACAVTLRIEKGGNLTGNDSMTLGNERFFGLDLNSTAGRDKALTSNGSCAGVSLLVSSTYVGSVTGSKGAIPTNLL